MITDSLFWAKVDKSGECWLWTGTKLPGGYGILTRKGKKHYAHRYAYALANGPIPDGKQVLHHCDNPPCVRPDHQFLGTQKDNVRDMVQKGRAWVWTKPERRPYGDRNGSRLHPERYPRGESHPDCKLSDQQVAEIRTRYKAGGVSQLTLAHEYGIGQSHISRIVRGASRKWFMECRDWEACEWRQREKGAA